MKNQNHFRQGDVAISKTNKSTRGLTEVKSLVQGRVVLAYGEVTGHHHSILIEKSLNTKLWKYDDNINILEVGTGGATIEHQEHASIFIPEGDYEVHIQVEYDPEGERRVTD